MIEITAAEVLERRRQALLSGDIDGFVELFTPDGVIEAPFLGPVGTGIRLAGHDQIRAYAAQIAAAPMRFEDFEVVDLHQTLNPEVVVVELITRGVATASGKPFAGTSIQILRIVGGRIALFRDFADSRGMDDLFAGSFLQELGAAAPAGERLATFGRFVGSWRLDWSRPGDAAAPTGVVGELHFGWVLDGLAVQDVWIVPAAGQPGAGERPYAFHGSTIRFFDEQLGAWRSTWVEPVNGRVRKFIGREVGDEIHLVSTDGDPFLRWRFTEISGDRFIWLGEYSNDEARNWILEERMVATRVGGTA